ncbi:glucose-1-phosphate cytidylyltransferase [Deinococcus pimensis]|uniref:glucose-1-phosphate cytidylyltransferase n=1 Tax=Deinococcus pimensis TaxID=309888 RepID=UPI0004836FF1|nr:glucose-1-phosphate cytidylyltransferase [Deinococcus pimensis]
MKAVILAGGYGTRISEESAVRPKPMIEIGGRPILWHIMKMYSAHGIHDFVVLCGYKQYMIKEYFANYFLHNCDVTFDLRSNQPNIHYAHAEPWRVTLVDTGENTMTGGRLRRVREYLDGTFCFTYGDGVGNVDITAAIDFHRRGGRLATMTVVQPPGRFGAVTLEEGHTVRSFQEKPNGDGAWINGGFFVLEPGVIDYIEGDDTTWEAEPLRDLARDGQLDAYRHSDFWQPMDTLRDKHYLEGLWSGGRAPWKVW